MCRPRQYQYFVFRHGEFVGTLSPVLMDSRTDGALTRLNIVSMKQLRAEYSRYAPVDPLCCPSGRTTVLFELEESPASLKAIAADTSSNPPAPPR